MKITSRHIGLLTLWMLSLGTLEAQETVFSGLGSSIKRADRYYDNQSYHNALELYQEVESRGKGGDNIYLKLARTSHQLNFSDQAVKWYEIFLKTNNTLPREDALIYAERLTSQGQYQLAVSWLKKCRDYDPDNQDILKKIWRLQNIHHLYADSSFYDVRPVKINTGYAEFGPGFLDQHLIFVSNRKEKGGISTVDQVTGQPFQSLYTVEIDYDSITGQYQFGKPAPFLKERSNGLHLGTTAATDDQIIFTRTALDGNTGNSVLQLFLAEKGANTWKEEIAFQHNNSEYSLSYPAFSSDGDTLYFVSDMPGGQGGNDLYKCHRTAKGWSVPVNLGETINTSGDETAPFIHDDKTLYFASNGHGGFGGLDIFKISIDPEFPSEVENLGFPVNTSHDDFGLILNAPGTHGFMASNRKSGGFDDDIYQVVVDLQSYPLTISGVVRYHDPDWGEPSRQELLPLAALSLTDNRRNAVVFETTSDSNGRFTLQIPYSSQYRIKVANEQVGELTVSLEIPKNRKRYTDHEIVVVKEKFKPEQ